MDGQRTAAVVVGVDRSRTALRAVRWAEREAGRRDAPLRIVHAAPYARGSAAGERRAGSILTMAHNVATRAGAGVSTSTHRLTGAMPQALVQAADAAQLLVVGMGGGSRFDDVLLHSAALDVCAAATCPVAVVRGRPTAAPDDGTVVLGVEDPASDAAAVTAAFADAQRHGARLAVVHTLHAGEAPGSVRPGHDARAAAERELLDGLAPWRSRHPDVPVEVAVVSGATAGQLLEASVSARLLVVGTRARGAAARVVLGSTSRTVLRRSSCPVLVVRRDAALAESVAPARAAATSASGTASASPAAQPPGPTRWTLHPQGRSERW
jgi:nucleotide-binding universal stress UspA family protein